LFLLSSSNASSKTSIPFTGTRLATVRITFSDFGINNCSNKFKFLDFGENGGYQLLLE
jgi:hypothetical protein